MASEHSNTVDSELVRQHASDWHGFTKFMTFGIGAVVVLLVGMAVFLL